MPEKVSIGTILVLHADFETVARNETRLAAVRRRASLMSQLLDDLLAYREQEGRRDS